MFQHRQAIDDRGRVLSAQTLDLEGAPGPIQPEATALEAAGRLYWRYLSRFGRGVLRLTMRRDGGVTVSALGFTLLVFGAPRLVPLGGGKALRYPIETGLAVHPRHTFEGHLQMGLEPWRVSLEVDLYVPRLPRPIYLLTQAPLHMHIARQYLALLVNEV